MKVFYSKANYPLANLCKDYIVNKSERVFWVGDLGLRVSK